MDNLLVSVIIPLYNAEMYISETITSVLNQTYTNIETIIIDDGSTDQSLHVAKQFESEKLKIFSQSNKGVSETRNYGIQLAKGTYIQFLDADDLIEKTKIERQVAEVKNMANKPAFVCSTWARVSDDSMLSTLSIHKPKLDELPIDFIAGDNFIPLMSGLILRESLLQAKGFDPKMTHIEDVNLLIRLYHLNHHFIYAETKVPLFYYREVASSASKKNYEAFFEGMFTNTHLMSEKFKIRRHKLLLENYWNIYINAVANNYQLLAKRAARELNNYGIGQLKKPSFNLFKILNHYLFCILYRALRTKNLPII